jgi:hypothetical protein
MTTSLGPCSPLGLPCHSPPPPAIPSSSYPCHLSFVLAAPPHCPFLIVISPPHHRLPRCCHGGGGGLAALHGFIACPVPIVLGCPPVPPASSCSQQVFGVLLVMVIALSWSSWSGSWACATTQPPHKQGLVAVVGWVRGRESLSILFLLVERKKEIWKKTYLWPRRHR